ncbi:hypothetical protein R5W23_000123 [Gemmata sp. JC673]|uniref:Uncharacterized protein n=1 Tax=Gemmata algarum TaxID=2975278 RepID=A0ABU5ER99_9BACT|nr:hypothetical protein [Gemmata algarum]MDY3557596.1 hypothetical protein [Gemmata algarum]
MPRNTEMIGHLESLKKKQEAGSNASSQYTTRLDVDTAIEFIEDCMAHYELPADGIRRILTFYYTLRKRGVAVGLGPVHRQILDDLCTATSSEIPEAIRNLIIEFGPQKLTRIRDALQVLKPADRKHT